MIKYCIICSTKNKGEFIVQWKVRKRGIFTVFILVLSFGLSACTSTATGVTQQEHDAAIAELNAELDNANKKSTQLQAKLSEIETKNQELQKLVEEAKPWFEMTKEEQKQKEAQLQKQKEAEEQQKLAAQEAERKAKEEEEKKGYDTGISYEQLARTPDDFEGKKVKFRGEVVQVMEGDDEVQLRIAVNRDYNSIIFVYYDKSITSSRILEDDTITIMGISKGLYTYKSTMGGQITIPLISVDKIEQ